MKHVERIYSAYSGFYDLLFDAILMPGRRRAVEAMELRRGHRVLEVGVGTGLSLPLYPPGCHVMGIDISQAMLNKAVEKVATLFAQRRGKFELGRMSADQLALPDASFDRVLLAYVVSCVEDPDRVVAEVHRVCARDGKVLFLNHFLGRARLRRRLETGLSPLTSRVGFALDTPLDVLTRTGLFEIERIEHVNMAGLWSLAVCAPRPKAIHGAWTRLHPIIAPMTAKKSAAESG